jgi:hypothetical protein
VQQNLNPENAQRRGFPHAVRGECNASGIPWSKSEQVQDEDIVLRNELLAAANSAMHLTELLGPPDECDTPAHRRGIMQTNARRSCFHPALRLLGTWGAFTILFLINPDRAAGQFEGFLEKVTDIQFSTSCWSSTGDFDRTACFRNYGVEVLWNLGRFPTPAKEPSTETRKLVRIDVTNGDTLFIYEPVPPTPPSPGPILLELGLGWGQITDFATSHSENELHGSVRELPSVSLYATLTNISGQPYVGIRSGIIRLQNAQMIAPAKTDTATVVKGYFGSAEAFQLGGVIGSALEVVENLHLTMEYAYHHRYFPSVTWAATPSDLPTGFPRSLDFSGHTLSFGFQVKLRDPK